MRECTRMNSLDDVSGELEQTGAANDDNKLAVADQDIKCREQENASAPADVSKKNELPPFPVISDGFTALSGRSLPCLPMIFDHAVDVLAGAEPAEGARIHPVSSLLAHPIRWRPKSSNLRTHQSGIQKPPAKSASSQSVLKTEKKGRKAPSDKSRILASNATLKKPSTDSIAASSKRSSKLRENSAPLKSASHNIQLASHPRPHDEPGKSRYSLRVRRQQLVSNSNDDSLSASSPGQASDDDFM